jgi:hypothetical protein
MKDRLIPIVVAVLVTVFVYVCVALSAQAVRDNRANPPIPTTIEVIDLSDYGAEEYTPNSYD